MTKYDKIIEKLGLSSSQKKNAFLVTYKKKNYCVYTDGAGLDMLSLGAETSETESHELFCKLFDGKYDVIGLQQALINAKATIVPVQKAGKYNLYKVQGYYELWRGRMGTQFSYRAGYVSNPDNLMNAIYAAEEEMRCMMAEAF
jgi:hypothetical protein